MAKQIKHEIDNRIVELWYEAIQETLKKHMPGNQPLVMDPVRPRLPIYREMTVSVVPRLNSLSAMRRANSRRHRIVMTFEGTLRETTQKVLQGACVSSWPSTVLAFFAVSQCRLADRLLEQLGCKDKYTINTEKIPSDFDTTAAQCLASIQQSQLPMTRFISGMAKSLWRKIAASTANSGQGMMNLRFVNTDDTIWIEWLTADGKVAQKDHLRDFVDSLMEPMAKELDIYRDRLQTAQTFHRKIGEKVLREVSPKLADALQLACQENRHVGIHLCTSKDRRGLPLDVWLYMNPTLQALTFGNCTLSVHRYHRDFILGARDGTRYYFPPCLLTARVNHSYNRYQVMPPTIRQPRGGHKWNHPYTGPLQHNPFTVALLVQDKKEVMCEPSQEALKLFPNLAHRTTEAQENSLCLQKQPHEVARIQNRLLQGIDGLCPLDVLGAITALHEFARIGLTHGHQNNTSGPRAPLAPGTMPYPLRGRQVYGRLAKRIFVYNPVW